MSSCVRRHPNHDKCFVVKVLSPHLLVTGKKEEKNEKDNENEKEEERRREKEARAIARTNQDCAAAETYKQRRYGPGNDAQSGGHTEKGGDDCPGFLRTCLQKETEIRFSPPGIQGERRRGCTSEAQG